MHYANKVAVLDWSTKYDFEIISVLVFKTVFEKKFELKPFILKFTLR